MQTFEGTNKEHYGLLWYFLEWSIDIEKGLVNNTYLDLKSVALKNYL